MSGDRLLHSDRHALQTGVPPHVDLRFVADAAGRTWLERQHAAYPFHVGRCLRVAGDPPGMATVYIQCCSGGIFEDDALRLELEAGPGALAHIATPASTVVHSMQRGEARQDVVVAAAAGAVLEYLPAPLILFPAARLRNRLRIRLDDGAAVLACDALLAHDPAHGTAPDQPVRWFDRIHSDLSVESSDGRLLARDRYQLFGTVLAGALPGVTGPFRCHGTVVVLQNGLPTAPMEHALRDELATVDAVYAGVSSLPNACGVLVRMLAPDALALRSGLRAVCATARFLLLNARQK